MKNKIKTEIRVISPPEATELLKLNTFNRKLNKSHVNYLTEEIIYNRWIVNGVPIIFNSHKLIDGQHRLHAIIQAGKPVQCLVVEGVDSDAFSTIDTGKRRNLADALHITGHTNSAKLAQTLIFVEKFYRGELEFGKPIPNTLMPDLLAKYQGIQKSIEYVGNKTKILPLRFAAGFHYIFSQIDAQSADKFVSDLIEGASLGYLDPVLTLRERLTANLVAKDKLSRNAMCGIIIKAWNYRCEGKRPANITFRTKGKNKESIPEIQSPKQS